MVDARGGRVPKYTRKKITSLVPWFPKVRPFPSHSILARPGRPVQPKCCLLVIPNVTMLNSCQSNPDGGARLPIQYARKHSRKDNKFRHHAVLCNHPMLLSPRSTRSL